MPLRLRTPLWGKNAFKTFGVKTLTVKYFRAETLEVETLRVELFWKTFILKTS